jgi:hypothetical protein
MFNLDSDPQNAFEWLEKQDFITVLTIVHADEIEDGETVKTLIEKYGYIMQDKIVEAYEGYQEGCYYEAMERC